MGAAGDEAIGGAGFAVCPPPLDAATPACVPPVDVVAPVFAARESEVRVALGGGVVGFCAGAISVSVDRRCVGATETVDELVAR